MRAFARVRADAALVLVGSDFRGGRRRPARLAARSRSTGPILVRDAAYGLEKLGVFAAADVFVHPSRWEGAPNAVLEAATLGLPCLLTPPADVLGRLSRGGGALVVEADVGALADGLRRLANMPADALATMGTRARAIVRAEFTWQRTAHALADAYARHARRSSAR